MKGGDNSAVYVKTVQEDVVMEMGVCGSAPVTDSEVEKVFQKCIYGNSCTPTSMCTAEMYCFF